MKVLYPAKTVGSQFLETIRIHKPQIDRASALSIAVEMLNFIRT
jgi:ABC-type dipeptide/oligopeptide/nickel transport system ATPase component